MESLECVRAYLDDILCISRYSLEDYLEKIDQVLRRHQDVDLKVNAEKLTFCTLEIEYPGYILTRDGIKPQSNKVQAIFACKLPKGVKQPRHFLSMVKYYRDLRARWSHIFASLTSLVGEYGQTKGTKVKQKEPRRDPGIGMRSIKGLSICKGSYCKKVVLAYPDYSKAFEIYTDPSSKQLGAVITQDNRPVTFFSQKLSVSQSKYSVTEIQLLAIVKTLKEFKGMLWG